MLSAPIPFNLEIIYLCFLSLRSFLFPKLHTCDLLHFFCFTFIAQNKKMNGCFCSLFNSEISSHLPLTDEFMSGTRCTDERRSSVTELWAVHCARGHCFVPLNKLLCVQQGFREFAFRRSCSLYPFFHFPLQPSPLGEGSGMGWPQY